MPTPKMSGGSGGKKKTITPSQEGVQYQGEAATRRRNTARITLPKSTKTGSQTRRRPS
jgi:hypothetical protein